MDFLPPEIGPFAAATLVAVSFLTSAMTAAFGIGGGVSFLAVLATVAPPAAIIPVHAVVQLGSNTGRTLMQRRHVQWGLCGVFVAGSVVGVALGGQVVVELPERLLQLMIGLFLLYAIWNPAKLRLQSDRGHGLPFLVGVVSAFLSMFVGATGPLTIAMLAPRLPDRHVFIGTHAACMTAQHALKIVAFGVLGFAFAPWLPLIAVIVATGFLGTVAGLRLLGRMPEKTFRTALKYLLTLLAANLLAEAAGLYGWLAGLA